MAEPKRDGKVDLWGAAFVDDPRESAPVALLRGQADALTERTGGRVEGVVLTEAEKGEVWASLYAKAPALQNYMYKLLSVSHSVLDDPDNPSPIVVDEDLGGLEGGTLPGMDEFREWLGHVLSSERAHAVIVNLLRYSTERAAS
jgi:hypothetical protein